ncbi:hypothetical protein [Shewanella algae]|uniref:hypothetical protein n=1 Tax=Shewanella algae TaxID=38313 RepID=UPI0031F5B529
MRVYTPPMTKTRMRTIQLLGVMGTEIFALLLLVPLIFMGFNIRRYRQAQDKNMHLLMLILGLLFVLLNVGRAALNGYPMQGLFLASLLYAPFYLVVWVVLSLLLRRNQSEAEARQASENT